MRLYVFCRSRVEYISERLWLAGEDDDDVLNYEWKNKSDVYANCHSCSRVVNL